jgi:hypothetical protein
MDRLESAGRTAKADTKYGGLSTAAAKPSVEMTSVKGEMASVMAR